LKSDADEKNSNADNKMQSAPRKKSDVAANEPKRKPAKRPYPNSSMLAILIYIRGLSSKLTGYC